METDVLPAEEILTDGRTRGWLEIQPERIARDQARRIACTSDGLLLIQPQSASQVPGKLFEYIQIGRPILAYVAPDSPSERILAQSGIPHRCVFPDSSPAEIETKLLEFLALPSDGKEPSTWFEQQFNSEQQTAQLLEVLKKASR
jgi:hypothetical protein